MKVKIREYESSKAETVWGVLAINLLKHKKI